MEDKLKIAVFIDFDNIEIGVKSTLQREFDVAAVLDALKERGEIVTKIAYANWGRQESSTRQLAEHAVQMVQRDPSPRDRAAERSRRVAERAVTGRERSGAARRPFRRLRRPFGPLARPPDAPLL